MSCKSYEKKLINLCTPKSSHINRKNGVLFNFDQKDLGLKEEKGKLTHDMIERRGDLEEAIHYPENGREEKAATSHDRETRLISKKELIVQKMHILRRRQHCSISMREGSLDGLPGDILEKVITKF